jgi:hypothetical protein
MCTGCVQTQCSTHEESDPDCIEIHLATIFGYVGGDIGELLLENIWITEMARSSGTGL